MTEYELYHIDDRGRKVDLSNTQKELADEAKERSAEKIAKKMEEDSGMTEDKYIAEFYSKDHDEYLVNGAILECDKAIKGFKLYRGKTYNVPSPDTTTVLNVTENPKAKCCGYLYHATIKDRKAGVNVPPFRCNCDEGPHNDKEWAKLEEDESCLTEGTCKALINLCDEWDNLPTEKPYMMFWNEDMQGMVPGITMSSMLFCRHGGIITAKTSGQDIEKILDSISSVAYSDGELWTEEMINMAKYVTVGMRMEGYSLETIAGFVGVFVLEGDFGHFEYTEEQENGPYEYKIHMNGHGYYTDLSGKYLSDVGTSMLKEYRKEGNCEDENHIFGLGVAQWTDNRCENLIDRYLDKFREKEEVDDDGNYNYYPTWEECAEVEMDYLFEELRSNGYKGVIEECEKEKEGMSDSERVEQNTQIVLAKYEFGGKRGIEKRQEAAKIWYNIITGESNEK